MKVEVKKVDKLKRIIKIEVTDEEFLAKKAEVYTQLGKNLKVPGFRPGNAPVEILEKYHDKFLKEEFLKEAIPFFYNKSLEQENLNPAAMPKIYDVNLTDRKIEFFAEFEIRPQIVLSDEDYKKLVIKDKDVYVSESEVEKILTNIKERIKRVVNKELSDDMVAHWASYPNIDKLKEAIRAEIFVEKLRDRREKINLQIFEQLLKNIKFDLPKVEVEKMHQQLLEHQIYTLKLQNTPPTDIEKYKKDLEDKLKPVAEEQTRLLYILNAIAQRENIKVENDLNVVIDFILSEAIFK
ncbi:MAG: hypothetical protein NC935_05215 [Candidatus Omnitrophica bacterium]|nr:hypothetical protein [Candidatus Omnitrophota bacterium]